jgi:hypothetical protein
MVRPYTDKQLLDRVAQLNTFKGLPEGRWILGVRSNEDIPNKFDDKFYVFDKDKFVMVMSGTTNPGVTILKHYESFNKHGAAILDSNRWYYDVWHYGMHRNKIAGLLQRGAPVLVHRDGDKDNKSEEIGPGIPGWYGINFHLNSHDINTQIVKEDINAWSAGCQVPNNPEKYRQLMGWFKSHQRVVSYCLLKEFEP